MTHTHIYVPRPRQTSRHSDTSQEPLGANEIKERERLDEKSHLTRCDAIKKKNDQNINKKKEKKGKKEGKK